MKRKVQARLHTRWFERLLAELGFELWVGDAAEIRAARVRKQRNDQRDARHILKLLMEEPSPENRDVSSLFTFMYFRSSSRRRFPLQFDLIVINGGTDEIF